MVDRIFHIHAALPSCVQRVLNQLLNDTNRTLNDLSCSYFVHNVFWKCSNRSSFGCHHSTVLHAEIIFLVFGA